MRLRMPAVRAISGGPRPWWRAAVVSRRLAAAAALGAALAGAPVAALPTRSSPLAVAPDGHVFVVNPDSSSVARLDFAAPPGRLTHERAVGQYPRTLALDATHVFTAGQKDDTLWRLDQADLGSVRGPVDLGFGCAPYGVAVTPAGDRVLVTCQGTSDLVILDTELASRVRIRLPWPNARAIAVASDGGAAYVSHYLTEEPGDHAHVSVVDLANKSVARVFAVAPDTTTCETQNSGQGALNLVSAIALMPEGAPPESANQLWIGGTQENNLSKGLFKRSSFFAGLPGAGLFPWVTFRPFPTGGVNRDVYRASFHDITRFGIYKLDATDGHVVGKLDIDEASNATDIELSPDGTTAYVVDPMFNSYHIFSTKKGQGADVTTLFASPSAFGPGGADPSRACVPDAQRAVAPENPFRLTPQAQIVVIDGYDPVDTINTVVATGLDFDAATYMTTGRSRMRKVADGVGTAPIGVRLAPDGRSAYVANYLARNVVRIAAAAPLDAASGLPDNLRCIKSDFTKRCGTNNDCPAASGFCNHPGGAACAQDADCGSNRPCVRGADCVPLILAAPVASIRGRCSAGTTARCRVDADCPGGEVCNDLVADPTVDPLPAALLDGKILFNTAARDASTTNAVGLGAAAPRFDDAALTGRAPGSAVSTSREGSYVACSTCHADFGGHDGRTWDFSQFGASLRNTVDLRGRAGFAPGTCSDDTSKECFFDAACDDDSGTPGFCKMNVNMIPPNVPAADRDRYFNPMLTAHWNGDRDEVEDFEHTLRSLMGCGDCDSAEDVSTCQGCLIQRSPLTSTDPADVHEDLGAPNRNLHAHGKNVGIRLTHVADFVYSLTSFVRNPNQPSAASERGRKIFDDPQTGCTSCHQGGPGVGKQFFTDKRPNPSFDPSQPGAADHNDPFVRHDVGTMNLFDAESPLAIAQRDQVFQNPRIPIPGARGPLGDYLTPVLNDVWNTAPYLHDGSAHTLLDVVRPCDTTVDDCLKAGRGRNLNGRHGITSILSPQQLNDLVAFLKALTLATIVGPNGRVISAGALDLSRVVLQFGNPQRRAQNRAIGKFRLKGALRGAPRPIDPTKDAVALSVATPQGDQMAIFARTVILRGRGRWLLGRSAVGGGVVTVALTPSGSGYRVRAKGRRLDLSALAPDAGDPRSRDLTVAIEVIGASFVRNRDLAFERGVFKLPRPGA